MPLGLEWADLKPAQSPGRTAGQGSEALKDQGQSVRKQADCNSSRGQGLLLKWRPLQLEWRPLQLYNVALLLQLSPGGEVITDLWLE